MTMPDYANMGDRALNLAVANVYGYCVINSHAKDGGVIISKGKDLSNECYCNWASSFDQCLRDFVAWICKHGCVMTMNYTVDHIGEYLFIVILDKNNRKIVDLDKEKYKEDFAKLFTIAFLTAWWKLTHESEAKDG